MDSMSNMDHHHHHIFPKNTLQNRNVLRTLDKVHRRAAECSIFIFFQPLECLSFS